MSILDFKDIYQCEADQRIAVESAKQVSKAYFRKITDKNGKPYFLHLQRVSEMTEAYLEAYRSCDEYPHEGVKLINSQQAQVVAYLHDILEDIPEFCEITIADMFGNDTLDAVISLTRFPNETYKDYVRRCCDNPIALIVKKADVNDNLSIFRYWDNCPVGRYFWTLEHIYKVEMGMIKSEKN